MFNASFAHDVIFGLNMLSAGLTNDTASLFIVVIVGLCVKWSRRFVQRHFAKHPSWSPCQRQKSMFVFTSKRSKQKGKRHHLTSSICPSSKEKGHVDMILRLRRGTKLSVEWAAMTNGSFQLSQAADIDTTNSQCLFGSGASGSGRCSRSDDLRNAIFCQDKNHVVLH